MAERGPASWRFLLALFTILFAGQIGLYWESFGVKPAGDDFAAPLAEIARGRAEGPAVFFQRSAQMHNYRPIQSLLMWRFGTISDEHRLQWIRVMAFACMAVYATAAMLWLKMMPGGKAGAVAAAIMIFFHPALPGAVAGIDGFAGPLATAFMWLGALAVFVFRDRLGLAIPLVILCFAVGGITKEYSLSIGPLAVWSTLVFWQRRWRAAMIIGASLALALVALMYVRHFTIPPGELNTGVGYVTVSAKVWAQNIGLLAMVMLFMGNSAWVMVRGDEVAYGVAGLMALVLVGVLAQGLAWQWRQAPPARRWIVYWLVSLPLAGAVPVLTPRVSEMYAVGLVLPFAALVGLSAEGWLGQSRAIRATAIVLFAAIVIWAAFSIHAKVAALLDCGEQTDSKLWKILAALPPDAHDQTVAVVIRGADLQSQRRYSVFVMNDYNQIYEPNALDWIAPQRRITLDVIPTDDLSGLDRSNHAHVLLWQLQYQEFRLLR